MKIFFVETTDMYREISFGRVAYADESEANRVAEEGQTKHGAIGYSYMVQELPVNYSHRNGETVSPKVDGWYWVEYLGQWTIERNPANDPDTTIEREHYWGPIPFPEGGGL